MFSFATGTLNATGSLLLDVEVLLDTPNHGFGREPAALTRLCRLAVLFPLAARGALREQFLILAPFPERVAVPRRLQLDRGQLEFGP